MDSDLSLFTCPKCAQEFSVEGMDVVSVRCPCGHTFKPRNAQTSFLMTVACAVIGFVTGLIYAIIVGVLAAITGFEILAYACPPLFFVGFWSGIAAFRKHFPGKVRIR